MKHYKPIAPQPLDDTSASDQDSDEIQQLKVALDELEQAIPVMTPNIQWFEQQVIEQRKMLKRRFIRDLSLFIILALVVLTLSFAAYNAIPQLFMLMQLVPFLVIPFYVVQKARKRVSE